MTFEIFNEKDRVLIPYFTFGDPSQDVTEQLICKAFDSGADIVELGIPFSDPIADGPVIQASHFRALSLEVKPTIQRALSVVKRVKESYKKPIVLMASINLILAFGGARFFEEARVSRLDGVIIPDLSIEDVDEFKTLSDTTGVSLILLVSTLCSPQRLKKIVQSTDGFLYLISTTGTTGTRSELSKALPGFVKKIKSIRNVPVCIGFGVSSPEHVDEICRFADGAIVGSHLVRELEFNGPDAVVKEIQRFSKIVTA